MSDFLTTAKFDNHMVLRATIEVSGGTEESFLHHSTALNYGYDLQEMADLKDSVGVIANDKAMQTEAVKCIKLKENNGRTWTTRPWQHY